MLKRLLSICVCSPHGHAYDNGVGLSTFYSLRSLHPLTDLAGLVKRSNDHDHHTTNRLIDRNRAQVDGYSFKSPSCYIPIPTTICHVFMFTMGLVWLYAVIRWFVVLHIVRPRFVDRSCHHASSLILLSTHVFLFMRLGGETDLDIANVCSVDTSLFSISPSKAQRYLSCTVPHEVSNTRAC
jgi:hypothetical protein